MIRWLFLLLPLLLITGCKDNEKQEEAPASENDVDAARNFIRSALDGDYAKAKEYMLQDSLNTQLLNTFEDNYMKSMSKDDKRGYRESSIRIPSINKLSDSVSVITYSNSYKNKLDSLKVIKVNGEYLVDFKYSFSSKSPQQ